MMSSSHNLLSLALHSSCIAKVDKSLKMELTLGVGIPEDIDLALETDSFSLSAATL